MDVVAIVLIILFAGYVIRNYSWRLVQAKRYGTETEAVVSRIERDVRTADGAEFPRSFYYVTFQTRNGLQNEARLLNPDTPLDVGTRVKVKYLPEKNAFAVLTEVAEESK